MEKKHLDSNLYKRIILKSKAEDINVKVELDQKFKNTQTQKLSTEVITKKINGLSDFEKVKEIVNIKNSEILETRGRQYKLEGIK